MRQKERPQQNVNDFKKLLRTYMAMTGTSITQISAGANVSPRSLSYYLSDEQSNTDLGSSKLANCLSFFNIDTDHYWKVVELAKKVAVNIKKKEIGMTSVGSLNKKELAVVSGCEEVYLFLDFNKKDLEEFFGKKENNKTNRLNQIDDTELLHEITKVGIIDVTSTFVYFKQLVNYYLKSSIVDYNSKLTSSEGAKVKEILAKKIKDISSEKLSNELKFAFNAPTKLGAAPLFSSIPMIGSIILGGASIALGLLLDDKSKDDEE